MADLFLFKKKTNTVQNVLERVRNIISSAALSVRFALRRQTALLKLNKGDIILAKPRLMKLTPISLLYRVLLGSEYVHSMLYMGRDTVLHSTMRYGVTLHRAPGKIHRSGRYSVFRYPGLTPQQREEITSAAEKYLKRKTDLSGLLLNIPRNMFRFSGRSSSPGGSGIWCSRIIFEAYASCGIELLPLSERYTITSERLSGSPLLEKIY